MSRGNRVVVNPDARGHFEWGYLTTAEKPGTILQINPSVALKHGKHTWTVYTRDADGDRPKGPFAVLIENLYEGKDATQAYAAGDFVKMYIPLPGDELNLLYKNVAGTADDVALGDILTVDSGTGKVQVTSGSVETEVAVALEAITDPTADQLLWVRWSGH
jgi:hypothetical protein